MVQPQLVKIGGPWTRSMIRESMDLVHEGGPCFVLSHNYRQLLSASVYKNVRAKIYSKQNISAIRY